ncbi:hypothetical protein ABBQ38_007761 [Trebouxia sp. C0009 RCD-2024]
MRGVLASPGNAGFNKMLYFHQKAAAIIASRLTAARCSNVRCVHVQLCAAVCRGLAPAAPEATPILIMMSSFHSTHHGMQAEVLLSTVRLNIRAKPPAGMQGHKVCWSHAGVTPLCQTLHG